MSGDADLPTRVLGDASTEPAAPATPAAKVPARVGRYTVVRRLGAGGMGEVFEALDPDLDRRVAVKLVKPGRAENVADAEARLRREAQALARLSHPHVVPVFDVGEHDGQIFVAMELIEGRTLSSWLDDHPPWSEVVRVLVGAGRGLAAAHEAGVVHRDFKPSNVMVGTDGRVRVLDFGLARETDATAARSGSLAPEPSDSLDSAASDLTEAGMVMGTPPYMAPEQFLGALADAQSDQFSFCVTAYRALYGQPPFPGDRLKALRRSVLAGELREPPRGSRVPTAIWVALRRGLARHPEARHETLGALLDAMERATRAGRGRTVAVVAIVGALGLGGLMWSTTPGTTCDEAAAPAHEVWNDGRRARVRSAFAATELAFADATWGRVDAGLTAYVDRWSHARTDACEAGASHATPAEEVGARVACLQRALQAADALVDELAGAEVGTVTSADDALRGLPELAACARVDAAAEGAAPADAAPIDAELERLRAALLAGRYEAVADEVRRTRDDAVALGYAPTVARAQALAADVEAKLGRNEAARVAYEAARQAYADTKNVRGEIQMQLQLAFVLGDELARADEALTQIRNARALVHRLGDPPELVAQVDQREGVAYLAKGDLDAAEAALRRAYERTEDATDPRLRRVLDSARSTLATVVARRGKFDESIELMQANIESTQARLGPDHPNLANSLSNLGATLNQRGRFEESRPILERAQAIYARSTGQDTARYATVLHNLGTLHFGQRDLKRAEEYLREAVRIKRRDLGIDHPSTAWVTTDLATCLVYQDRPAEALPLLRDAVTGFEQAQGDASPGQVFAYNTLLQVLVAEGRLDEAAGYLDKAQRLSEMKTVDPAAAGALRWAVADVTWRTGGDRARALTLAREGRQMLMDSQRPVEAQLATLDAWIAEREPMVPADAE